MKDSPTDAMDTRPLDLSLLCRETVERMAPVLERCRVRTALEEPCPVRGDPRFLEMAVKNFLSNAAAHTPEGGEVAVEGGRVLLERRGRYVSRGPSGFWR